MSLNTLRDESVASSPPLKRRGLCGSSSKRTRTEEHEEATLEFHCELWEKKTGVAVSIATMSRAIREKLGWTYKKRRPSHRAR